MPGILPMKVIKVGTNSQSRIAQACDRCRSKKIRCDGFRPTCSQCANVGFECKTSDKLSRRAFPRGYTESLEERVRSLEAESRELKDSLDERDEKIDMLSRIQSQYSGRQASTPRRASSTSSSGARVDIVSSLQQEKEDVFKAQQSPFLHIEENDEPYFAGTSNGRSFLDAFKRKVQESGTPCAALDTDVFFPAVHPTIGSIPTSPGRITSWIAPPRLLSDQMVNIFFQEWAPLFPVLHRPTFLALYDKYMSNTDAVEDMESLAQLNLVFGIAALSNSSRIPHDTERCEAQWQAALHAFMFDISTTTLQCLILAQIYCIQKGDFSKLLHYKSLAIGMAQRLGLHQSQKRFALGALTSETRKKVFWTLYTLDCFSAASMGLPRLMKDEDIHCEYPVDADDEYVTEQGFQPTLPGEATKLSAALALFRACRTLAKTLEEVYPASSSHEISLRAITALNGELDDWYENLPSHLRLTFVQEKPSTNVISSRCPLLCLTYHYIRMLIHRPVACASIGERSSNSIMVVASSSKSLVQIIRLLDERNFSFSFCTNRNELLTLSGFGLLFQALDLDKEGKMIQDSQRLVCSVIDLLDRGSAPGAAEFRSIGCDMISAGNRLKHDSGIPIRPVEMSPPASLAGSQLTLASARYATHKLGRKDTGQSTSTRRSNHSTPSSTSRRKSDNAKTSSSKSSANSLTSLPSDTSSNGQGRSYSNSSISNSSSRAKLAGSPNEQQNTNLDFFSFPDDPNPPTKQKTPRPSGANWEQLLSSIDSSQTVMYDNSYNFQGNDGLVSPLSQPDSSPEAIFKAPFANSPDESLINSDWSPSHMWSMSGESAAEGNRNAPQSVLSFSDESLTSGEEFSSIGDVASSRSNSAFRGIVMPHFGTADGDSLDFEELTL